MIRTLLITASILTACTVSAQEYLPLTEWQRAGLQEMIDDSMAPRARFIVDHVCHDSGVARVEVSIGALYDHFYTCPAEHWRDGMDVTQDMYYK